MTPNPTQAEIEAAYMRVHDVMEFADGQPPRADVYTLLAAVARDTLGWREVENVWRLKTPKPTRWEASPELNIRCWIKDAAP